MFVIANVIAVLAVSGKRGARDDAELAGSLAALRGIADRRLRTHAAAVLDGIFCAATAAIARRERGLALDPPQHDQVDVAAIPALVRQVAGQK